MRARRYASRKFRATGLKDTVVTLENVLKAGEFCLQQPSAFSSALAERIAEILLTG
jgi:hypothetical protein